MPGTAVAMMALGLFSFTLSDASVKRLVMGGLTVLQVALARYARPFLVSLAMILPRGGLGQFCSPLPGFRPCGRWCSCPAPCPTSPDRS